MSRIHIVALIPAHNEAESIAATLDALTAQTRRPDRVIVIPNGCTDDTAEIARQYPITVIELPQLQHKKSEALNRAWTAHAQDADVVICLDADTVLPSNAIQDWEREFTDPTLGGSSSKFTMLGTDFLTRLQRAEFSKWTDTALRRGKTTVLAGTGCAISGEALREVAFIRDTENGPWAYTSQVEDFELTYRIRELGYRCQVSPTVRAYTDSMKTVRSLWGQRMKWQVGTVEDLIDLGVNRLTVFDWYQQVSGLCMATIRFAWAVALTLMIVLHLMQFSLVWVVIVPALFALTETIAALRIPYRDWIDVVGSALIVPQEIFAWMRAFWFVAAWWEVLVSKVTKQRKDRWVLQYRAEGM